VRGRKAAGVDAIGAAMGSIGLLLFALGTWQLIQRDSAWVTLGAAPLAWLASSVLLWSLRNRLSTILHKVRHQT